MKNISNYLKENQQLHIADDDNAISEGLKEIWDVVKSKFAKVVEWFGGLVARISSKFPVWLALDSEGNVLPVSIPATASQSYKDGYINKTSTVVIPTPTVRKMTGNSAKPSDCYKLYGSGNSIEYWKRALKESKDRTDAEREKTILENSDFKTKEELLNEVALQSKTAGTKYNTVDGKGLMRAVNVALTGKFVQPLLIYGAPGVGKTAILENVIKSLPDGSDWHLITKTLSNETPDNFFLPKYTENEHGEERATDVPKTWIPVYRPTGDSEKDKKADEELGKGLLFLDELSRATAQVLNVCLPLINERRLNDWKMGSGWRVIAASNRMEDEQEGQIAIGNAMANRWRILNFEPTINDWLDWAKKQNYISPLLLQWLSMGDNTIGGAQYFYYDPNEKGDDEYPGNIMATPRAWDNAMKVLCCYANTGSLEGFSIFDIPEEIIEEALGGIIPDEAIAGFMAFLKAVRGIGNFDEAVKEVWTNEGKNLKIQQKTLRQISIPLAQLICISHSKSLPTTKEFASMCKWLVNKGDDQIASMVIDIFKNVFFGALPENHRDDGFSIGYILQEYGNILKNIPEDYKKLKSPAEQKAWFEKKTKGLPEDSEEYLKYDAIYSAQDRYDYYLKEAEIISAKMGWKDPANFPEYANAIVDLGKKYGNGIQIELANNETHTLFGKIEK